MHIHAQKVKLASFRVLRSAADEIVTRQLKVLATQLPEKSVPQLIAKDNEITVLMRRQYVNNSASFAEQKIAINNTRNMIGESTIMPALLFVAAQILIAAYRRKYTNLADSILTMSSENMMAFYA